MMKYRNTGLAGGALLLIIATAVWWRSAGVPQPSEPQDAPEAASSTGFSLRSSQARPGEETRLTSHAVPDGSFTVLIGELSYDSARLRFKDCDVSGAVQQTS